MVNLATRCKYNVVGKFSNTMPRMEVIIRRLWPKLNEKGGGVKIAHFNARTVYTDLDNEYDHVTAWTRQFMNKS